MEYFTQLNLKKDPFGKLADPDFFYASSHHLDLLQRLESTIRLRQGLNVVIGDAGIGKTALCLQLLKQFGSREDLVEARLIADPSFGSVVEFLQTIGTTLGIMNADPQAGEDELKESIKNMLYRDVVEQEKVVALMIDDGQKLPAFCLKVLRELLNYETNSAKLLQVVIFARPEFSLAGEQQANLADRIANLYQLQPLGFAETRNMIRFRLQRANDNQRLFPELFTFWAQLAIFRATGGYPRKIVTLCAKALDTLVNRNGSKVTAPLVLDCSRWMSPAGTRRKRSGAGMKFSLALLLLLLAIPFWHGNFSLLSLSSISSYFHQEMATRQNVSTGKDKPALPPQHQVATPATNERPALPPTAELQAAAAPPDRNDSAAMPFAARNEPVPEAQNQPARTSPPPLPATQPAPAIPATAATPDLPKRGGNSARPTLEARPLKLVADRPMLGTLRTGDGDVLSKMIARIYGRFNEPDLTMVLRANPWIGDINAIPAGSTVRFPANIEPYPFPVELNDYFWLQLAQFDTLNEAYPYLRAYPENLPPILLVPIREQESGLSFKVVLENHFHSEQQASDELARLPEKFREKAAIFTRWPEGTVVLTRDLGNSL